MDDHTQVSAKAQDSSNISEGGIDALPESRYSQGQIPDLVANTIPWFLIKAAQSLSFALPSSAAPAACSRNSSETFAHAFFTIQSAAAVRGRSRTVSASAPNCRQGGLLNL
ncbi:MAG: hypothetical protein WBE38_19345 [Terracidiphilus sp.]